MVSFKDSQSNQYNGLKINCKKVCIKLVSIVDISHINHRKIKNENLLLSNFSVIINIKTKTKEEKNIVGKIEKKLSDILPFIDEKSHISLIW